MMKSGVEDATPGSGMIGEGGKPFRKERDSGA